MAYAFNLYPKNAIFMQKFAMSATPERIKIFYLSMFTDQTRRGQYGIKDCASPVSAILSK